MTGSNENRIGNVATSGALFMKNATSMVHECPSLSFSVLVFQSTRPAAPAVPARDSAAMNVIHIEKRCMKGARDFVIDTSVRGRTVHRADVSREPARASCGYESSPGGQMQRNRTARSAPGFT